MKIVTYNVNGLRQRVAQHGSLLKLLNSLDADIICLQETKLTRRDLSVDLTYAKGYEAFLSCTRGSSRGRLAYSGVATFCRVKSAFGSDEVALPVAAEEGFTGLLQGSRKDEPMIGNFELELLLNVKGLEDVTNEDLLKVDSEGRCVITDHGHFVLFNLYGPRAVEDDEERLRFKLVFFRVLQKRWESLLNQGRRVIVVGDLNISPAAIDRCDAEPGFEKNIKEAYTFFSPRVGAEEFNYGSRIDHILIAGPCLHKEHDLESHNFSDCHAHECDIMIQFKRGKLENTSKWQGGRTIKLDGSDHIPVYAVLCNLPCLSVHSTPPLAVRYIPEVRGWQQTIVSFLRKRENPAVSNIQSDERTEVNDNWKSTLSPACETTSNSASEAQCSFSSLNDHSDVLKTNEKLMLAETQRDQSLHHCETTVMKKARRSTYSQTTLKSFFKQSKVLNFMVTVNTDTPHTQAGSEKHSENIFRETESACAKNPMENVEDNSSELIVPATNVCSQDPDDINSCSSKMGKGNAAVLEWQIIQEKMRTSIPLCKGHREPCVARSVKKGPNVGRRFYVCARAKGPESEPEANCNYFQWASVKSKEKGN